MIVRIRRVLVALAVTLAMLASVSPSVASSPIYAYLATSYQFSYTRVALIYNGQNTIQTVYRGATSLNGVYAIAVPANYRVYYQAYSTGRYYWSVCAGSSGAWQSIGAAVRIIKTSLPNCVISA